MSDLSTPTTATSTAALNTAINPPPTSPVLVAAGYEDGEDTMRRPSTYEVINGIGNILNRNEQVALLAHKGVGRDEGKVVFTVLFPHKDMPATETEERLFEAIQRNFYKGRKPKVARFQTVSDVVAF